MMFPKNCALKNESKSNLKVCQFRRFISQFIATTSGCLLLFDLGISSFFPAIIIPAMTGFPNQHNQNEALSLTPQQASWLGSVSLISALFGCILSTLTTDVFGRKRSMILVNLPLAIAWFLMCNANSIGEIFIANILLGFGCGLMESPVVAYVGEICEPKFRSVLMAYTYVGSTFGSLFVSILNTLMPWRMVAFVCTFVPILTIINLCFIPESPLWLLSKNQMAEAETALCWLRGFVSTDVTFDEFQSLQRYNDRSKCCGLCLKQQLKCGHPLPNVIEKLKELQRKQTLKPFFIVITLICMLQFSRLITVKSFIVQIFRAYESPVPPDQAAALLNLMNNIAHITFLFIIHFTGKRRLYLIMLMMIFISTLAICGYGFAILPKGYNSFDHSQIVSIPNKHFAYIPFICIIVGSFCSYCGVNSAPSQMLSELFSFKIRGIITGLMATFGYLLNFIITKWYYNLETVLSLPGVTLVPCIIIGFGLILLYRILPETTNRSLEDIEIHFSDNSKKITNRKIAKSELKHGVFVGKSTNFDKKLANPSVDEFKQVNESN